MTDADVPELTAAAYDLPEPAPKKPFPWWGWLGLGTAIFLSVVVIAGFVIRVDYFTIAPGEAVGLEELVTVDGAKTFPDDRGDIRLLFVRERNHVSLWRYLQAKLDGDIDLYPEEQLNPDNRSPTQLQNQAVQQMADAKNYAIKVALEAAGYKVEQAPGLTVSDITIGYPAEKLVELGDTIISADGKKITGNEDLGKVVNQHKEGESVKLEIERDGKRQTLDVPVKFNEQLDRLLMGVTVSPRYTFPVTVNIDTAGIGGPSAGLAMSLAIIDDLTPGDLTGGNRAAVTGTIGPNGAVGPIGGLDQKAVAARAAGARVFLVPACDPESAPEAVQACKDEIAHATERAGKNVKVIPVSSLDEALAALRENGGAPVERVGASDRAA